MCMLAGVCKKYEADYSLSINQRHVFAETYAFLKQFASLPGAGGAHSIRIVISTACGACQTTFDHECPGRDDWRQPCVLVQNLA